MSATGSYTATEFKAKCLDIFDQLAARKLSRVTVTKRGRVVAVLTPPDQPEAVAETLYGCLRGTVISPPDFDLTEPIADEPFLAAEGRLHG
jgi:antitoxin (DNA-binding transcriptional repressor) of toxin-antitoxin stability system